MKQRDEIKNDFLLPTVLRTAGSYLLDGYNYNVIMI